MSPPIQKDWWLAAALTGAALPAAMGQVPPTAEGRQTGVVTSVTQGAPTTDASTPIYIDNTRGQRLTTGPNQTMHVLFSDQSAITVGPNSELVITEYRYDSETKDGTLQVEMSRGLLRVVGGFISKKSETVVRTGAAEVGIRGGITMVDHQDGRTSANFLFGQQMRVSSTDGSQSQTVTRQGFGITSQGDQQSAPRRTPHSELSGVLSRLETSNQGSQTTGTPSPAPSSGGSSPSPSPSPSTGGLANDRLAGRQNPNQLQNANPSEVLRTILGTDAPNQS